VLGAYRRVLDFQIQLFLSSIDTGLLCSQMEESLTAQLAHATSENSKMAETISALQVDIFNLTRFQEC
jgi:hypothetical protein